MADRQQLILRLAETADRPGVARCAKAAYGLYLARMDRPPAPLLADYGALIAAGELHVLVDRRDIVGFIVLRPNPDHLFVENLAVDPGRQGRGHGRRLMAFAESHAGALGLAALRLYTNAVMRENIPFYENLGFAVTARRREDGYDRVYMGKRLAAS